MKDKEVKLTVVGVVEGDDVDEMNVQLTTFGKLSKNDKVWKLKYQEITPENGPHLITITMNDETVTMNREGELSTSMVFKLGQRHEGMLSTPFGILDMGVYPTKVEFNVDDEGAGKIFLKYQLDLGGRFASFHNLNIDFAPNKATRA